MRLNTYEHTYMNIYRKHIKRNLATDNESDI